MRTYFRILTPENAAPSSHTILAQPSHLFYPGQDDPQIDLIFKAVENHKANATQPAKKTEAPKAEKPVTKAVPKPKAKKTTKGETGA